MKDKIFNLVTVIFYLCLSPIIIILTVLQLIRSFFSSSPRAIKDPKVIVITGASSGIGKELALQYAKAGLDIAITGRNENRLKEVAEECEEKGAKVHIINVDVLDRERLSNELLHFDEEYPIDILIANAGLSDEMTNKTNKIESAYDVFETNTIGVMNTIFPIIEKMKSRRRGQIAIMGSLAGFYPLRAAIAYSASKFAVRAFGLGYRNLLKKHNIGVSVITPGFVRTPLTDRNKFSMPFLMEVKDAGTYIINGLKKDNSIITFPFIFSVLTNFASIIPPDISATLGI